MKKLSLSLNEPKTIVTQIVGFVLFPPSALHVLRFNQPFSMLFFLDTFKKDDDYTKLILAANDQSKSFICFSFV